MSKRIRQYLGIVMAVISYYIVHEGAHFLYAILTGSFKQINFMGIGIQIDVFRENMSNIQLGLFCIAGAAATFICGWILIIFSKKICHIQSQVARAILYYITLVMLFLDPLYLGILCGLFGSGDMNGISLLLPEWIARIGFVAIGLLHLYVFAKKVLPLYQASFRRSEATV